MKILGNFDSERIKQAIQIKYKHLSYEIFKHLCANQETYCDEKYTMIFSELLAYFSKGSSKENVIKRAIREYALDNENTRQQIEQSLEKYFLEYSYKKHLLK